MAIAMYCNLRPPDFTPVVSEISPAYKFSNSTTSAQTHIAHIVSNVSEIEQSAAELMRLRCVDCVHRCAVRHPGFDRKWILSQFRGLRGSMVMNQRIKFRHNPATRRRFTDDLANFSRSLLRRLQLQLQLKTSTCSTDTFKRSLETFLFQSAYGCETRVGWLL